MSVERSLTWAIGDLLDKIEGLEAQLKDLKTELEDAHRELGYTKSAYDRLDQRLHEAWQKMEDLGLGLDFIMPDSQPEGMNDHIWELLLKTRAYDDIPF